MRCRYVTVCLLMIILGFVLLKCRVIFIAPIVCRDWNEYLDFIVMNYLF